MKTLTKKKTMRHITICSLQYCGNFLVNKHILNSHKLMICYKTLTNSCFFFFLGFWMSMLRLQIFSAEFFFRYVFRVGKEEISCFAFENKKNARITFVMQWLYSLSFPIKKWVIYRPISGKRKILFIKLRIYKK